MNYIELLYITKKIKSAVVSNTTCRKQMKTAISARICLNSPALTLVVWVGGFKLMRLEIPPFRKKDNQSVPFLPWKQRDTMGHHNFWMFLGLVNCTSCGLQSHLDHGTTTTNIPFPWHGGNGNLHVQALLPAAIYCLHSMRTFVLSQIATRQGCTAN